MSEQVQPVQPVQPVQSQGHQSSNARYQNAFGAMGSQMINSLWGYIEQPENKARLMNILDPIIQHIIKSIFPYIAFSAVLFVLLLIVAVMTLVVTLKATQQTSWFNSPITPALTSVIDNLNVTAAAASV
jgi:hypothetical protein